MLRTRCCRCCKRIRPTHDNTRTFCLGSSRSEPCRGESVSVLADNAAPRHLYIERYGVARYGFNGQCTPLPSWSPAGLCVGTAANTRAPDGESCETAGAGCDCLRPSGIVSASRARVCLDASDRGASAPGASELFHGIRWVLFPLSSSL